MQPKIIGALALAVSLSASAFGADVQVIKTAIIQKVQCEAVIQDEQNVNYQGTVIVAQVKEEGPVTGVIGGFRSLVMHAPIYILTATENKQFVNKEGEKLCESLNALRQSGQTVDVVIENGMFDIPMFLGYIDGESGFILTGNNSAEVSK